MIESFFAPVAFAAVPGRAVRGEEGAWAPALDVSEKGDVITVRADMPGVDPEKIDVTVQDDVLTLRGTKEEAVEEEGETFVRSERRFGSFMRQVTLPAPVDESKVNATYKDGVLRIELRRSKSAQPRRIPVTSEPR
jgi:HSP20 family protein